REEWPAIGQECEMDPELLKILACPHCRASLREEGKDELVCEGCRRRYPVIDGIPELLPESAKEGE
ncbi:MAG: Trm112 family protein, partial [Candidatus Krumholzibacteria bacterium]|nr:Trm112 family protein [Candidatus Krumholzibacteria bacterium]